MNKLLAKPVITVSKSAWDKMSSVLKAQNRRAFLFSAEGGGCNGYNYSLATVGDKEYKSLHEGKVRPIRIVDTNSSVLVDPLSEMLLLGTHIDYVPEDFSSNIFESKFTFTQNKDIATSCGCGVSFSPKMAD
jgi:iron-sulfur cluster assembly accessory protein